MGFHDFVTSAVKKGGVVNAQPRGRQQAQAAIDKINAANPTTEETAFDDVEGVLSGDSTIRTQRKSLRELDICDAVLPPNKVAGAGTPTLSVSISPNSWNDGANTATAPAVQAIAAFAPAGTPPVNYQSVMQVNPARHRLMIQNNGTGNLFIVFGKASQFNADVTTKYHMRIVPGQTYFDDSWQGRIDVASDSGTSISVAEFVRAENVSQ